MKNLLFISSFLLLFSCSIKDAGLFTAPTQANTGTELNIKYSKPISSTSTNRCWITIVKKDAPDKEWGKWKYVKDQATSDVLTVPGEPGNYEIRLHDNYPKESFHVLERHALTVK